MAATHDMTQGKPLKVIFTFFFPLLLGNLFQQFYSAVDSMIVGRYVGVEAFAGISATGSVNFMILGFMMGMCAGLTIPMAQAFGAGDHKQMRKYFANAIYLAAIVSVIMTILTVIACKPILRLIGTPADIIDEAYSYIVIIFGGMSASMLYNLASGTLRAVGNTRTPLYFLIFSCIVNIALDLLFVLGLKMGAAGAAIATIISQLMAGILCMLLIFKKYDVLRIRREEWKWETSHIKHLFNIGLPMGLQFSITAIGSIVMQSAVNSLGSGAVAAIGAGAKVQFMFTCAMDTIGATMATYCSQNLGARKIQRIRTGVRQTTIIMLIYCVAAFIIQHFLGRYIALLFIDPSETHILSNVTYYLSLIGLFYWALLFIMIYRNALQGLGYSRITMVAGIFEMIGRTFVAFVLVGPFGFKGACFANPSAWIMAIILLIPVYFRVMKKLEGQHTQEV